LHEKLGAEFDLDQTFAFVDWRAWRIGSIVYCSRMAVMSPAARTIIDLNIRRYRELLVTETDLTKRETIIWLLAEEEAKLSRMEQRGDNSEECRRPDIREWVDRRGTQLSVEHLKTVRTGIGAALRALHSDVLREAVADRIAELLRRIDRQKNPDRG
jgi:hypothetical protein